MKKAKFFCSEIEDRLKCGVCKELAQDAKQHDSCGTIFCTTCCDGNLECPTCKAPNAKYHNDGRSQREIKHLRVYCNNKDRDCTWEGEFSAFSGHLEKCDYAYISCPNGCDSDEFLQRKDLHNHLTQHCPERLYTCEMCGLEGTYDDITRYHMCPEEVTECSNTGCNEEYLQKEKSAHMSTCEYQVVDCQYDCFGCPVKKMRQEMEEHLKASKKAHLDCALKKIKDLKATIFKLKSDITDLEDKYSKILSKDNFMTFQVKNIMNRQCFESQSFYVLSKEGHKVVIVVEPFEGNICLTLKCVQTGKMVFPEICLKVELLNQKKDGDHIVTHLDFAEINYCHRNLVTYDTLRDKEDYRLEDIIYLRVSITPIQKPWLACTNTQNSRFHIKSAGLQPFVCHS